MAEAAIVGRSVSALRSASRASARSANHLVLFGLKLHLRVLALDCVEALSKLFAQARPGHELRAFVCWSYAASRELAEASASSSSPTLASAPL
eukprot:7748141-Alexandrium_andersonii.AAC.1